MDQNCQIWSHFQDYVAMLLRFNKKISELTQLLLIFMSVYGIGANKVTLLCISTSIFGILIFPSIVRKREKKLKNPYLRAATPKHW